MTRKEYKNMLFSTYSLVSVLSEKNGCEVIRLRHKVLNKDIVLHLSDVENKVYDLLCSVKCENLPEIYYSVVLDDGYAVLEEYIDGITVSEVMESGHYHYRGVKKVIYSVCNALSLLHENGFVHRDIKPENIMIEKSGRVVLIDFNTVRTVNGSKRDTVIIGTVGFAAPEQLGLSESDTRADIYALAVLLNVMLTGVHPSERIAKGKAGKIVRKCTKINPQERIQTVEKLCESL